MSHLASGNEPAEGEHCYHHSHTTTGCGGYEEDCDDEANDYCVCCECCCTCLGCEYGPRDGMLLFPNRLSAEVPS